MIKMDYEKKATAKTHFETRKNRKIETLKKSTHISGGRKQ